MKLAPYYQVHIILLTLITHQPIRHKHEALCLLSRLLLRLLLCLLLLLWLCLLALPLLLLFLLLCLLWLLLFLLLCRLPLLLHQVPVQLRPSCLRRLLWRA